MDASSTAALARIWADATPLAKFIEERAERLAGEALSATLPRRDIQPSATMERLAIYAQFQTNLMVARGQATRDTINDLVAGRLVALGRRSGSHDIEQIDPPRWIGADVIGDTMSRDGSKMIDVRIVLPDALPAAQPQRPSNPEVLARVEVIEAAIREYAKTHSDWSESRSKRYQAYRAYIASHGFNLKRGFSDKNLEKYELKFRHKSE